MNFAKNCEGMTPSQKLKYHILLRDAECGYLSIDANMADVNASNIDNLYEDARANGITFEEEIREGECETNIDQPNKDYNFLSFLRNYDDQSVAAQMPDGTWVGWTRFSGGGKHGQPELYDWINSCYPLFCKEEEKLVVVRSFALIQGLTDWPQHQAEKVEKQVQNGNE